MRVYSARAQFHESQIKALGDFLNGTPTGAIGPNEGNPIAAAALQSALKNLSPGNQNGFKLEIISPQNPGNPGSDPPVSIGPFIALDRIPLNGSILYVNFNVVGDGCVGQPGFLDFDSMSGGVYKVRDVVTYFAVKASTVPIFFLCPNFGSIKTFRE